MDMFESLYGSLFLGFVVDVRCALQPAHMSFVHFRFEISFLMSLIMLHEWISLYIVLVVRHYIFEPRFYSLCGLFLMFECLIDI